MRHLLGTDHGVQGKDLGEEGGVKPVEAVWHDRAPEGKLDLLVTMIKRALLEGPRVKQAAAA